jgi:hypothetical protein
VDRTLAKLAGTAHLCIQFLPAALRFLTLVVFFLGSTTGFAGFSPPIGMDNGQYDEISKNGRPYTKISCGFEQKLANNQSCN